MARPARDALTHLEAASLDQLLAEFPAEWQALGEPLVQASRQGPQALAAFVQAAQLAAAPWAEKVKKSHANPEVVAAALPRLASARLAQLAVARLAQSAAAGITEGAVRLSRWDAFWVQRLFFVQGLERRPVSLRAFKLGWPLVRAKRKVMPLVQQRGIYCFYSAELVAGLAQMIAGRSCVELAAGDGTLSRFLAARGAAVRATDDQSWAHAVTYPEAVERLDAAAALQKYRPQVVLCSFPPPDNAFEKRVLRDEQVQLYVVVTTRHRFAASDWKAYEGSERLVMRTEARLSQGVLPPELDPVVLCFDRVG